MGRPLAIIAGIVLGLATTAGAVVALSPPALPPLAQAIAAEERGDLAQAESLYRQVIRDASQPVSAVEAHRRLAAIYTARGEFGPASDAMKAVVEQGSATPGDLLQWGELQIANRRIKGAASTWLQVAERGTIPLEWRLEAARRLSSIGRAEEAASAYQSLVGTEVKLQALCEWAVMQASLGDYEGAYAYLGQAEAAGPGSADAAAAQGALALAVGDLDGAREGFDEALKLELSHRGASLGLARWHMGRHEDEEALAILSGLIEEREDPLVRLTLAAATLRSRAGAVPIKAAQAHCEAIEAATPGHPLAFECAARVALARGDVGRAQRGIKGVTEMAPGRVEAALLLVTTRRKLGDEKAALAAAQAWLERWPGQLAVEVERARILIAMRDLEGAEASIRSVIERFPGYARAWVALGELHLAQGKLGDAVADFIDASQLSTRSIEARYGLAAAYQEIRRYGESRSALEEILQIRPAEYGAHLRLAVIDAAQADESGAIKHLKQAVSLGAGPDDIAGVSGLESLVDLPDYQRLLSGGG